MTNAELEVELQKIISTNNIFDAILMAKQFEKEYVKSDFYKATKIKLFDIIKNAKLWYWCDMDYVGRRLQERIDSLDLSHLTQLRDQAGDMFSTENKEFMEVADKYKELFGNNPLFNKKK